eukprot:gene13865-21238_t
MPSRYRDELISRSSGQLIITIDAVDPCLCVYPLDEWELIETKLRALPSLREENRRLQRLLIGNAVDLELDGSGRFLVPPRLREYAKLDKRAMLVGQLNKFQFGFNHITVLLDEAVEALAVRADGCYLDGTFGRGGHSRLILSQLGPDGKLLGFDKDPQAIATGQALAAEDGRFVVVQRSFAELGAEVAERGMAGKVAGVLLDLGVSSPQLDDPERGFSFMNDGPLDMRMDPSRGISAAQFIATAPHEEITRVFKEYGEERFAGRMARAVVERREIQPFERTADLAEVLKVANPAWEKGKNPATRAFQGLRIHVNNELGDLEAGLEAALEALEVGGRLVVISFHSLEDRIVKLFMRRLVKGESDNLPRNLPVRYEAFVPKIKIHGKAQFASEAELKANPRARSAVMRVAEKLR